MPDEIVADAGAGAAPVDAGAAAPTTTPQTTGEPVQQEGEQPQFDASIFDGQEEEIPVDQQANPLQELLSISPYIRDEQTLQNAIQRQNDVEAVLAGQQPASSLFEGMRQQNPQQWTQIMNGVAQYIEQVSGLKLVDPSQMQQQMTPEQQRIAALEQQQRGYQESTRQQQMQQQVSQAQRQLIDALPELTKGRFVEGDDPQWLMSQLGSRLAGKEAQVIAGIQRGDMSMIKNEISKMAHEERIRFNARGKRVAQQRLATKDALPKTNGGKGNEPTLKDGQIDITQKDWFGKVAKQIMTQ